MDFGSLLSTLGIRRESAHSYPPFFGSAKPGDLPTIRPDRYEGFIREMLARAAASRKKSVEAGGIRVLAFSCLFTTTGELECYLAQDHTWDPIGEEILGRAFLSWEGFVQTLNGCLKIGDPAVPGMEYPKILEGRLVPYGGGWDLFCLILQCQQGAVRSKPKPIRLSCDCGCCGCGYG